MDYIIISDDLSGAAGMASMLGSGIPVIPFNKIEYVSVQKYKIISLDLETRNITGIIGKLEIVRKKFPEYNILTRIDTLLRGSTKEFIEFISRYNDIALTDTIPDYGRYTSNNYTIYRKSRHNLNKCIPEIARNRTYIFDSKTHDDLKDIAKHCLSGNLIPVDPGPLISTYLEMIQ